jgi:hypothetical protein
MAYSIATPIRYKTVKEVLDFSVSFAPKLNGSTLTGTATVTDPAGQLVIDQVVIVQDRVYFRCAGGYAGRAYQLDVQCPTMGRVTGKVEAYLPLKVVT